MAEARPRPAKSVLEAAHGLLPAQTMGNRHDQRRRHRRASPVEMVSQQRHVAAVGAPHHVEGVAEERHRADHAVERDVDQHPRDQMAGRAELARLAHDVERHQRGDRVADAGNEPDHAHRSRSGCWCPA